MTDKDLKRLRRDELLEMLIAQSKRTEQLERELEEARTALQSRDIFLEEAGSIAEAALRINGVFEAAQAAAQQYLDNIRRISGVRPEAAAEPEKPGETAAEPENPGENPKAGTDGPEEAAPAAEENAPADQAEGEKGR
ncbi:MAG: hypothetical protein K2P26_03475 [Oscillospiraceae bacterium]|nr:hypothetical protein [Oscillospiraceae bacterium]